jgi:triacylglycerol lipase
VTADFSWQAALNPGASREYFKDARPRPFRPGATGFDPINAWWLSELSRLIYRQDTTEGVKVPPGESREAILSRVGLTETCFFSKDTIQGALVETVGGVEHAFAVLVFRGTGGHLANWLVNFDAALTPWPSGGRVHRGIQTAFMALWNFIGAQLQDIRKPMFFTGHSLGGALATLTGSLHPPRAVYTFGTPRIGDADFAATLDGLSLFNVFNPEDIVSDLPPSGRWSRFTHAGTRIVNPHLPSSRRRLTEAPVFLAGHAPFNYTNQLTYAFAN